jgi:hypothetical protein
VSGLRHPKQLLTKNYHKFNLCDPKPLDDHLHSDMFRWHIYHHYQGEKEFTLEAGTPLVRHSPCYAHIVRTHPQELISVCIAVNNSIKMHSENNVAKSSATFDPYLSNVELNSTVLFFVPGTMSSSNGRVILLCFMLVFP